MSDPIPQDTTQSQAAVVRFATYGAAIGAVLGVALTFLLRSTLGPTDHALVKTVAVVCIVAAFGAFVGVLVEAFLRTRRA